MERPGIGLSCQTVEDHPDTALVTVVGSIDAKTILNFKDEMRRLVDDGTRRFILDCRQLTYINSTGLAYLVSLAGDIEPEGGTISLAAVDPKIRVIFKMMGLLELFEFPPSCADALDKLRSSDELTPEAKTPEVTIPEARTPEVTIPEEVAEASEPSGPELLADAGAGSAGEAPEEIPAEPPADSPDRAPAPAPAAVPPPAPRGNAVARFFRWLFGLGQPAA